MPVMSQQPMYATVQQPMYAAPQQQPYYPGAGTYPGAPLSQASGGAGA